MSEKDNKGTKSDFLKMVKELGLTPTEVKEMLGSPTRKADGTVRHAKGGVVKKQLAGGGMMKMAKKKKMQRGGSVMSAVAKNKNPAASANMRKDLANYSKAAAAAKPGARKGNTSPGKRMMRGGMAKKK
tara:strand:+ start:45 stop:431 length:387 start_codon:yes stop_codon:yes gene_type:complete